MIDIDGTICEDIPNEESERFPDAKLFHGAVEFVNKLYEQGHYIWFFTARRTKHFEVTWMWLLKHEFKFHGLICDKPRGGNYVWIDNLDVTGVKFNGSYDLPLPSLSHNQ
jgi:uncharacterized HAD superfamily protein